MQEIILKVNGMHCEGCENRIKNVVSSIEGIESVIANHEEGTVTIKTNKAVEIDEIKEAISDLGFEVE